jgi:microcompartment protein CcmL/EutN
MPGNALGFIETIGLTAAVEAADSAVKSANVRLLGYELAKGDGMTTVKIEGDVGAVKAAVKAAGVAAGKIGRVVSIHVIPRPAAGTERITLSRETTGLPGAEKTSIDSVPKSVKTPSKPARAPVEPVQVPPESAKLSSESAETPAEPVQIPSESAKVSSESARPSGEQKDVKKSKEQSRKAKAGKTADPQPNKDHETSPFELKN